MNKEEIKKFLKEYPKSKRLQVLGILYDEGLIEQRPYSVSELSELTGYSRTQINTILNIALNNFKKIAKEKGVLWVTK